MKIWEESKTFWSAVYTDDQTIIKKVEARKQQKIISVKGMEI